MGARTSHYMQSTAFAEYMAHLGWQHAIVGTGQTKAIALLRTLPLLGTVVKVPKLTCPFPLSELDQLVTGQRPVFIRLEPNVPADRIDQKVYSNLKAHGFGPTWNSGELSTIQVDLRPSSETLFTAIARENTRRNIKAAQKNKVIVKESSDVAAFWIAHQQTGRAKHFWTPGLAELTAFWQAFAKHNQVKILTARSQKGQLLAAVMLVLYQGVCYYRYVAATDDGYRLRAPTLLVWESWLFAKKAGCQTFDFYGVYDDRSPARSWQGFSHFKLGFSNNVIRFMLPHAKYYLPFGPAIRFFDRIV